MSSFIVHFDRPTQVYEWPEHAPDPDARMPAEHPLVQVGPGSFPAELRAVAGGRTLILALIGVPGWEGKIVGGREAMLRSRPGVEVERVGEAAPMPMPEIKVAPYRSPGIAVALTAEAIQAVARMNEDRAIVLAPAPELVDTAWGPMALGRGEGQADEESPQFAHDCESCTFLGRYRHDGDDYDLYHCNASEVAGPTVLARYGDRDSHNMSGIACAQVGNLILIEAYRRAEARGLNLETALNASFISEAFRNRHQSAAHPGRADLGGGAAGPPDSANDPPDLDAPAARLTAGVGRWVSGAIGGYAKAIQAELVRLAAERDAARGEVERLTAEMQETLDQSARVLGQSTELAVKVENLMAEVAGLREENKSLAADYEVRLDRARKAYDSRNLLYEEQYSETLEVQDENQLLRLALLRITDPRDDPIDRQFGLHVCIARDALAAADAGPEAIEKLTEQYEATRARYGPGPGPGRDQAPPGGSAGRPGPVDPSLSRPSGDLAGIEEPSGERAGGQRS